MKRLLCIVSSMDRGGAETFLMKLYRMLDKTKYQMDFCVSNTNKGYYDDEIKKMGGRIFVVPQKSKNPIKSFIAVKKIVKDNKYDSVLRTCQRSLATLDLIAAKLGGAKKLIYRSSNAGDTGGKIGSFVNKFFGFLPKIVPNIKIAPSTEAAKYVFGKRAVDKGKVIFLHNGLDYKQFRFNSEIRNKLRKEHNLENKNIYGHVGRFNTQKNHEFLLEIFKEITKRDKKAILLLIGEGELEENIKEKIKELKLEERVRILGSKPNVNEYLMAIDLFIFPSFFEGMPNVIIEAQAAGVPCIISDTITKEVNITGLVKHISLKAGASYWADISLESINYERKDLSNKIVKAGYDIQSCVDMFTNIVFENDINFREG